MSAEALEEISVEVVRCRACPRLVEWRERVAREKIARFADQEYWGRPVPGFGDPDARILVVGLAPAPHGGNRTGRIFTGDPSGDFLFACLHRAGFANQAASVARDDGLELRDVYVTAVNRCVPPEHKPTSQERANCLPFLVREIASLTSLRVLVALGERAWNGSLLALSESAPIPKPRPSFGHSEEVRVGRYMLLGSYHTSPHNTFTRKLTAEMLDAVFRRAKELAR